MAARFLIPLLFLQFLATSADPDTLKINDFLFSGGIEFIDLSHPIDNGTIYWPGAKKFEFTKKFAAYSPRHGFWYSSNEFCAAEHGGTHLDAPVHFAEDKWTVGQIPIDHLITPMIIVDLSSLVAGNPDFVLERHHVNNILAVDSKRNFTMIFKFGWSKFYGNPAKYLGAAVPNADNLKFPGISEDVAKWITETRTLVGVGIDTPSIDPGAETKAPAHRALTAKNIFILENVNMERTMPSNLCAIVIMPMKIQEGTGAPCRLTALCPRTNVHNFFY